MTVFWLWVLDLPFATVSVAVNVPGDWYVCVAVGSGGSPWPDAFGDPSPKSRVHDVAWPWLDDPSKVTVSGAIPDVGITSIDAVGVAALAWAAGDATTAPAVTRIAIVPIAYRRPPHRRLTGHHLSGARAPQTPTKSPVGCQTSASALNSYRPEPPQEVPSPPEPRPPTLATCSRPGAAGSQRSSPRSARHTRVVLGSEPSRKRGLGVFSQPNRNGGAPPASASHTTIRRESLRGRRPPGCFSSTATCRGPQRRVDLSLRLPPSRPGGRRPAVSCRPSVDPVVATPAWSASTSLSRVRIPHRNQRRQVRRSGPAT